ncbi:hypothetical protein GJ607_11620 [Escherichia coli]|nr:hypothetical protein [Escherichia coli]
MVPAQWCCAGTATTSCVTRHPSYWEEWKKVREVVKVACPECGGKGEVSTA